MQKVWRLYKESRPTEQGLYLCVINVAQWDAVAPYIMRWTGEDFQSRLHDPVAKDMFVTHWQKIEMPDRHLRDVIRKDEATA